MTSANRRHTPLPTQTLRAPQAKPVIVWVFRGPVCSSCRPSVTREIDTEPLPCNDREGGAARPDRLVRSARQAKPGVSAPMAHNPSSAFSLHAQADRLDRS